MTLDVKSEPVGNTVMTEWVVFVVWSEEGAPTATSCLSVVRLQTTRRFGVLIVCHDGNAWKHVVGICITIGSQLPAYQTFDLRLDTIVSYNGERDYLKKRNVSQQNFVQMGEIEKAMGTTVSKWLVDQTGEELKNKQIHTFKVLRLSDTLIANWCLYRVNETYMFCIQIALPFDLIFISMN